MRLLGCQKVLFLWREAQLGIGLPHVWHCRVLEGTTMWNGWGVTGSWHGACVSHLSCLLCRCDALHNVKAPSPRGSWAIPNFAMGRALWAISRGPFLSCRKWGQCAQERGADDAVQQSTLLILQCTSLPEVTRECLPDGSQKSAFERHMKECQR